MSFLDKFDFMNLFTIFLFSLVLNTILFSLIGFGYFGDNLKNKFLDLFIRRKNLMSVFIFIISSIIIFSLNNNVLHLDENIVVTTKIEETTFEFSEETSKIIQELEKFDLNWRDIFINSPLEADKELYQFVLNMLNNNILLHFINIYLLTMLLIIFMSKLVLNNTEFHFLKKYFLGQYISHFLVKYISIWQKSGNVWIFFIVICVILFNIVAILSLSHLMTILK